MAWTTSIADLRTMLSDGDTDHRCFRKKIVGRVDGTNVNFSTFEFRRVTDFTSAPAPLGIYVNGVHASPSTDDVTSGCFTLRSAPDVSAVLEATYYYQWFTDAEISAFIVHALYWLGMSNDPTGVPTGLIPAILHYAAKDSYYKMSLKWRERASSSFMLEDAPRKEAIAAATGFEGMVKSTYDMAKDLRDAYYSRAGQDLQPIFSTISSGVRPLLRG